MVMAIVIFASIIVLIGATQCSMPAFTRPDLFFAITVNLEFRHTASARAILRRYRIAVVIHTIAALLLTGLPLLAPELVALPVVGVLWQLGGTTLAYLGARRRPTHSLLHRRWNEKRRSTREVLGLPEGGRSFRGRFCCSSV